MEISVLPNMELYSQLMYNGDGFSPFAGARYLTNRINQSAVQAYFGLGLGGHNDGKFFQTQTGFRFAVARNIEFRLGFIGFYEFNTDYPENIGALELGIGLRF